MSERVIAGGEPAGPESPTAEQVDAVLTAGYPLLRFPAPLEQLFDRDTDRSRCVALTRGYLGGLIGYLLVTPGLARLLPDAAERVVAVHLGIVTPLTLAFLLWLRSHPRALLREAAAGLLALLGVAFGAWLRLSSHAPGAVYHQYAMLVMVLFTNLALPLRFGFALACTASMLALHAGLLWRFAVLPPETRNWAIWLVAAAGLVSLIACYRMEYEERRGWLLRLHDGLLRARLNASNRALQELTGTDPLTGLPNRRRFQERLDEAWLNGLACGAPVAVLVIDIDHFKAYNDHYGHLAGDACLRRAGTLMAEALRGGDLLCRYGGEEFVVVLPDLEEEAALLVAERLRRAVEAAAEPHLGLGPGRTLSVSIGAAAALPRPGGSAQELIDRADQALYAAKRAGRNRSLRLHGAPATA
jgi:diguanylate cyclase (GGDEF)-like protein